MNMLKKHLIRAGTIILVFGIAALVLAYFLGYYDLSFLDRYKIIDELLGDGTPHETTGGIGSLFTIPDEASPGVELTSGEQSGADTVSNGERPDDAVAESYETENINAVFTTKRLQDKLLLNASNGGKTISELKKSGYHIAGSTYSEAAALMPASDADADSADSNGARPTTPGRYAPAAGRAALSRGRTRWRSSGRPGAGPSDTSTPTTAPSYTSGRVRCLSPRATSATSSARWTSRPGS